MDNKEQIVRDLVDTFEHRNHLHMIYKKQVKEMLLSYSDYLALVLETLDNENFNGKFSWKNIEMIVDNFIEMIIKKEES